MKKLAMAAIAAATLMFASCTSINPVCATSNSVGSKVGESTAKYLFGCVPMSGADASIKSAAKNGGISKISTVDKKVKLGFLFTEITTVISGE